MVVNIKDELICQSILEDWMWFRGDRVEILTGHDKGKQGFIIRVVQERNWVSFVHINIPSTAMSTINRSFAPL